MGRGRVSVADLVGLVVLSAAGLSCLLFASTPWARASFSVALAAMTLALVGAACTRGARRASWVGFAVCGWAYLLFWHGPWFVHYVRPKLVTTQLLEWAYPWLISPERRPDHVRFERERFVLPMASLREGLTVNGLGDATIDVWVKSDRDGPASLLVEGVRVSRQPEAADTVLGTAIDVDRDQNSKLAEAKAYSRQFVLRPHAPNPLAPLWAAPPVTPRDFEEVGHPLFALLCAWAGARAGRYAFTTREPEPGRPS